MDSVVQPRRASVDLVVVHVVQAGGGTIIHHRILLLRPVPLRPVLRITMLHHQDAPSSRRRSVLGEARRLLAHHRLWLGRDGGVPQAQVAAAAVDASLEGSAVVIADALGGGAAELVELLVVLGHGGIGQVAGRVAAQSAELVVRGLKARVEEGRVKVISVEKTHTHTHMVHIMLRKTQFK